MPEHLHLPPVAQGVVAITAVALAVVRLLTASRPFWDWKVIPVWVQKALPAVLMAVAALPMAIEHARTWVDVAVGIVVVVGTWYTASRGDKRPPEDKGGGPRIERVNSDPDGKPEDWLEPDKTPPSLPGARLVGLALVLLLAGTLALSQQACNRDARPCSAEDLASGPMAEHDAKCAAERQLRFPDMSDDDCMLEPGCAELVADCDRWNEERCK